MFILSSNKRLEPELSNFNRLYAYPNIPNITPDHMIILDSGAFALSCKNAKMDDEYIQNLAKHYEQYLEYENVYFIAPDVFKFPDLSMKQYLYFKSICDVDVAPVIQFKSSIADIFSAKKQIRFYKEHSPNLRLICISNHAFKIEKELNALQQIVKIIKSSFENIKIHILGAGFNSFDVMQWMKTGASSMDSISYYTDAQAKQSWKIGASHTETTNSDFKTTALYNAKVAIRSALL